jgi:hypothetical protein
MHPNTTPVPNALFDVHLKTLKSTELKVLLLIIRQTMGWADSRAVHGRKEMDWISSGQLQTKTGCSRRAITIATGILIDKNLIEVLDEQGTMLTSPTMRKGKPRLYYRLSSTFKTPVDNECRTGLHPLTTDEACANFAQDLRKKRTALAQKMRITKLTLQN